MTLSDREAPQGESTGVWGEPVVEVVETVGVAGIIGTAGVAGAVKVTEVVTVAVKITDLLSEVLIKLADVIVASQHRLEGRLQLSERRKEELQQEQKPALPGDHISPVDVFEERVSLDGIGVQGAGAKTLGDLAF